MIAPAVVFAGVILCNVYVVDKCFDMRLDWFGLCVQSRRYVQKLKWPSDNSWVLSHPGCVWGCPKMFQRECQMSPCIDGLVLELGDSYGIFEILHGDS
jgi:hypothetical protein